MDIVIRSSTKNIFLLAIQLELTPKIMYYYVIISSIW